MEEEGFGFAVLESEDLAVAPNIDFALSTSFPSLTVHQKKGYSTEREQWASRGSHARLGSSVAWGLHEAYLAGIDFLPAEGVFKGTHVGDGD